MDKKASNSIQRARLCSGLTQEALAERPGYDRPVVLQLYAYDVSYLRRRHSL